MRRKILVLNNISGVFFFLSSVSLLGVPFLDQSNRLSSVAYLLAGLFWIGLLVGIGIQIVISAMMKKMKDRKKKVYKQRKMLIPIIALLLLFILIICFWKTSVVLISLDIALLLFSIEIYIYLKRRYSV